jgi:hypothetical protein
MKIQKMMALGCAFSLFSTVSAFAADPASGLPPKPPKGPAIISRDGRLPLPPNGEFPPDRKQMPPGTLPGNFNPPDHVTQGTAAVNLNEAATVEGGTYASQKDDENALRVTGSKVTLTDVTVRKDGGASSNTEGGDFYGMNAAVLATDGATLTIANSRIESAAKNGNALFSYGKGTTVMARNLTIRTGGDNSGGIQTTGGAKTLAQQLDVLTAGNSSAAIRSDRGGGTVTVTGGTYKTRGYGSPAIYSTAAISVTDADLVAAHSEGAVIEGKNSIALTDCRLESTMASKRPMGPRTVEEENLHGVMIYQSMSGDAEEGRSSFSMNGGFLRVHSGDVLYVTNTDCEISLNGVAVTKDDPKAAFLRVVGNSASRGWGEAGKNGGRAEVRTENQLLSGNLVVDTASRVDLTLGKDSTLEGAAILEKNTAGSIDGYGIHMTIEDGAVWEMTGDSVVTTLDNRGTLHKNGHTLTVLKK